MTRVEGFRRSVAISFLCFGMVGGAGCSLLTGLDDLKEVACAQDCGHGGSSLDASDASGMPDATEPSGEESDDASPTPADGSNEALPEAGADASDASLDGGAWDSVAADVDASATESGPADSGFDAEAAPRCGSGPLRPKAATASSVHANPPATLMVDGPAPLAVDGSFATRWESEWMRDPSWIDLDFGGAVTIDEVDILWQTACALNYTILVSKDAVSWSVVKNGVITGNRTGAATPPVDWTMAVRHTNLSGVGRFLRIDGTARCEGMYGYSMWEMRVFGDPNPGCQP